MPVARAGFLARKKVQTTLFDVAQARCEAVAEEGHEAEYMVRCPARIGVVLLDRQAGLVIQQAIQHIGRFASGCRDHPTCEGVISIRDMGVEGDARFVAAARVDIADRGPTAPGMKLLSVARRSGAVSPQRGERHGAMGVDQPSQRFAIGGLADVPVVKMGELAQTCAPAGFRHACEAEIDAIGEDDREQRIAIVGFPARTTMDEAFAEPSPGIDLQQKIGDLHARQSIIGGATGNLGGGRCCRFQRRDDEAVFVKPDLRQLALSGEDRHLFDRRVEPGAPFLDMVIEIRFDGERQQPLLAKRRKGRRRYEIAVKIAKLPASRDPYIPSSQPLAQLRQGA
jgi:hypothetical protein